MTADTVIAYIFLLLFPVSITCGIINAVQLKSFINLCRSAGNDPFIQRRKPVLIIIYCIVALISELFTLPYITFAHVLCTQHDINKPSSISWMNMSNKHRMNMIQSKWFFEFIHEISTCFLLLDIAIRSWCLYYDYKWSIAQVNKVWRSLINGTDVSLWLKYKKSLGNYRFLLKVISFTVPFILLIFLILHWTIHLRLYGFMADFTVAIPISIFILWMGYNVRDTRDKFRIKDELYRLSICVGIVGFSFITWFIKEVIIDKFNLYNQDTVDIHLLMYTVDIIFTYFTVYIQTAWVIQHCVTTKKKTLNPDHGRFSNSIHSRSQSKLTMVDILRSKEGFEAFVNHCVAEVNVEGLLFLVEVSQFKERVKRDGDSGEEKFETYCIDVSKENLHRMLIEQNQAEDDLIMDPADMRNISRASSLRKRVSAMVRGINSIAVVKSNTSSTATTGNRSLANSNFSVESPVPILNSQHLQQMPLQLQDHSSGSVALPKGPTNLRTGRSNTAHEENYNNFQSGILDRGWLPLSTALKSGTETMGNGDISSDVEKEEKDFMNESNDQKYNEIIQTLTQPNTADEAEEIGEEQAGATTEQVNTDIGNQTDTQILPEDEEIDIEAPEQTHMITPPPSNHGTPISTNTPTERTMKFSQLKADKLSIGEPHPHSNHIITNRDKHIIRQVQLKKGSSAPVTPIGTIKSTPRKPNVSTMNFHSNSSRDKDKDIRTYDRPLRAPAMSLPSFIGSDIGKESKMDDDIIINMEHPSPKRLKKTDTFRNSFKLMIHSNINMTKAKSTSSTAGAGSKLPSPIDPYHDNTLDLFKRAQYIYGKYIPTVCDLSVNLSYHTRQYLVDLFESTTPEIAIDMIYNSCLDELSEEEKEVIDNHEHHRVRLLKTYIYHLFDQAFTEIWALIRDDSFLRFQSTVPYQQLVDAVSNTPRDSLKKFGLPTKSRTGSLQNSPNINNIPPPITMDNTPSLGTSQRLTTLQMTTPPPMIPPSIMSNFSGSTGIPLETIPMEQLKMMKFEVDSDEDDDGLVIVEEDEIQDQVDNVNNARLHIQISSSCNDGKKYQE